MVGASRCPAPSILEQLALGCMSPEEVERLAEHCERCERCVAALQHLRTEDTLTDAMRSQATSADTALPERVRQLMQGLKRLWTPSGGAGLTQTAAAPPAAGRGPDANMPAASRPADVEHTQELYDFLAPAQEPDELGRLGTYRVLKVLGAGGMGVVFLAEEPELKRRVALKTMKPALAASATARKRFLREAQAMAAVQHDHIVHINQIGQEHGIPFLAMPYLEGETLEDRLQRESHLPPVEVVRIGREVAEGLAAAHACGLIHRDIKPANLWLEGKRGRVRILDFGLARAADDDARLTQVGAIAGTPAYMAPEQAQGGTVDGRSDVFSLGCLLYRAATGEPPFKGRNSREILRSLEVVQPGAPRELNPAVPTLLSNLILRLLAKNPDERPQSAGQVVEALQAIEGAATPGHLRRDQSPAESDVQADTLTPTLPTEQAQEKAAAGRFRRRSVLVACGLAAVLLAAGIIFFARTRTATVLINVDVDLTDKTLSFVLDGEGIDAKELAKPIELKVGPHELIVFRGRDIMKQMRFTVGGEPNPGIAFQEVTRPRPKPPVGPVDAGWVALFNGKDLDGWQTQPDAERNWRVEDGILTVSGNVVEPSCLFTKRGDYQDFHFFVEARINDGGDSGQFLRCALVPGAEPGGYEAQINSTHSDRSKTGSLNGLAESPKGLVKPGEWFTQEVIVQSNHIVIKVNGKPTVEYTDKEKRFTLGHLALQHNAPKVTVAEFRVIKVKELKPASKGKTDVVPPVADPDRVAAEWFHGLGSAMRLRSEGRDFNVNQFGTLPMEPFKILFFYCDSDRHLTDRAMRERLTGLSEVEGFDTGAQIDGTGFLCFKDNPKPIGLELFKAPITDDGLEAIGQIPQLESLFTNSRHITDAGLVHLSKHSEMRRLGLHCPFITDVGFKHLKGLINIGDLNLDRTQVGDASLPLLVDWKRLDRLTLRHTQVSDDGMTHVAKIPMLRDLDLANTSVGDAGLAHLQQAKNLQILRLQNTKVTDAGVTAFQKAKPACKVER